MVISLLSKVLVIVISYYFAICLGPMGYYEDPTFAHGTFELLRYMDRRTSHGATTIIAGGDTIAAAHECGSTHLSHISLGGGASLMMLSGRSLPGVEALPDAPLEAL